jgi:DNA-binding MarR family transcriptional regulator
MPKIRIPDDYHDQTPEASARATEAAMNTLRTADMLYDRIGRLLRPLDVSAAGGLVLALLRDGGPLSPSEIGEQLIVTRATVTGVVDSLERRELVRRRPNPADRRSILVDITPAGLDIVQQVRSLIHGRERDWMAVLSAAELSAYVEFHHRIQDSLEATDRDTP